MRNGNKKEGSRNVLFTERSKKEKRVTFAKQKSCDFVVAAEVNAKCEFENSKTRLTSTNSSISNRLLFFEDIDLKSLFKDFSVG